MRATLPCGAQACIRPWRGCACRAPRWSFGRRCLCRALVGVSGCRLNVLKPVAFCTCAQMPPSQQGNDAAEARRRAGEAALKYACCPFGGLHYAHAPLQLGESDWC